MQLRQLRYVLEVYRKGNHISSAAEALNTSQPGISKQIRQLELELGFDIFERTRNRIVGVTAAGLEVIGNAERIFREVDDIQKISDDYSEEKGGRLTIATTHTFARYVLPNVIREFFQKQPNVQIGLLQGNPTEVCEHVQAGRADVGVSTAPQKTFLGLVRLPILTITRSVIAPKDHPIAKIDKITLEELAKYPLIGHDGFRSGGWTILDTFAKAGIKPLIPFAGVDSDVGKTYVNIGLGIAITASIAFDPERDKNLVMRDVSYLFPSSPAYVSFRKSSYLRKIEIDFMQKLSPELTRQKIRASREETVSRTAETEPEGDGNARYQY
jgi:LysR family transcriptional regulator, cys regulon transcriptional activator